MENNLVEETYFSKENELHYTGSSQIKSFMDCEARTMAKINGEWEETKTTALLVGSYVDNAISGTLEQFKNENPEIFKKDGNLKSDYVKAEQILERMKKDPLFMKYISGNHQTIYVGEIENVPVKIKIDSYFPDKAIVDLKCVKSFDYIWNDKTKQKENFIDNYGYTIQAALYQEIVRQNTGKTLPFFIAAITKETEPDLGIFAIPDDVLQIKLEEIKAILPRIKDLKEGNSKPSRCEHCDYCKATKVLTQIIDYRDM